MSAEYLARNHILVQNTPDILDPRQVEGCRGPVATLILHLLARSAHLALTGDEVVIARETPPDFLRYIEAVTGERPAFSRAAVREPLFTGDLLSSIQTGGILDPYIQWPSAARFAQERGLRMAFTSAEQILDGVVDRANNKAYFREVAGELGIPIAPHQYILEIDDEQTIAEAVENTLVDFDGAFIQASVSGGGMGNIDMQRKLSFVISSKLRWSTSIRAAAKKVVDWAEEIRPTGSDKVIVAPYLEHKASYTVSGFIPPDGDPFLYGTFRQILHSGSNDYVGFEWPAFDKFIQRGDGATMEAATTNWLYHLQQLGYVGPSDVDFIIGKGKKFGEILAASESNTRWDAFRFALQHAARISNWNLRDLRGINPYGSVAIKAIDHVASKVGSTSELVDALSGVVPMLGIDGGDRGVVVMVPPRRKGRHYETALAVVASGAKEARKIYQEAESRIKP